MKISGNSISIFVSLLIGIALVRFAFAKENEGTAAHKQESSHRQISSKEGYLHFKGHKIWYRIVGDHDEPGKYPIICLHGGPGVPHDYMEPLEKIAQSGRRVIFYDQLGCGNSDRPDSPELWTVDYFKSELVEVLKQLKISKYHLLGNSWGGMLALEHSLTQPKGLQSMILASGLASMPQWIAETQRLRSELPKSVREVLDRNETAGTTQSKEYDAAVQDFYHRHVCRLNPWPEYVNRAFAKIGTSVYQKMTGPNEFTPTGTLKSWDVSGRLSEISISTLITSGKYDEATPLVTKTLKDGIKNSQWTLFQNSAHLAFVEESDLFNTSVIKFLDEVEEGPSGN